MKESLAIDAGTVETTVTETVVGDGWGSKSWGGNVGVDGIRAQNWGSNGQWSGVGGNWGSDQSWGLSGEGVGVGGWDTVVDHALVATETVAGKWVGGGSSQDSSEDGEGLHD